jgi:hypothetical protein
MALVFNTMLILRVGQGNSQDRNENQSNLNQITKIFKNMELYKM